VTEELRWGVSDRDRAGRFNGVRGTDVVGCAGDAVSFASLS